MNSIKKETRVALPLQAKDGQLEIFDIGSRIPVGTEKVWSHLFWIFNPFYFRSNRQFSLFCRTHLPFLVERNNSI
jgi:hypothetical protein